MYRVKTAVECEKSDEKELLFIALLQRSVNRMRKSSKMDKQPWICLVYVL